MMLIAISSQPPTVNAADPFLDAIRQEVHSVEIDTRNQKSITGQTPSPSIHQPARTLTRKKPKIETNMPAGMSREAFDAYLQQHYFGSYAFYKKLRHGKQQKIYTTYIQHPNIEFVREKIKKAYLNQ